LLMVKFHVLFVSCYGLEQAVVSLILNSISCVYMIDSHRRPVSNRRPLLKSVQF
jgi:hypothetical protein